MDGIIKLLLETSVRWAYVATLTFLCAHAYADDFGNDPRRATTIGHGASLVGVIEVGDDQDWFMIRLDTPTDFAVYTTGSLDTVGELYDTYGVDRITREGRYAPVAEDDDGGTGLNFRIDHKGRPGSTGIDLLFWVRVQSYGHATGGYVLNLELRDDSSAPSSDDHGNTISSASRLEIGFVLDGRIEQSDDEDYFRVESDGLQHLEIFTTGGTDTYGYLLQQNGDQVYTVARDNNSGTGRNFRIQARVSAGTYYLKVQGNRSNTGEYGLETRGAYVASSVGREVDEGRNIEVGSVFRDCLECPLMVVIPGGTYRMGRPLAEPKGWFASANADLPLTRVRIGGSSRAPLAIGVHEVTYGQWLACKDAGVCEASGHGHTGGHDFPVSHVNFQDARQYIRWLSSKTGKTYRLPSEAEWEWAARGGTQTAYSFGDRINRNWAMYGTNDTVPVGTYSPNPFGLYDVHGNVREMTSNCWNPTLERIRFDGSSGRLGDCSKRVVRGGAYARRNDATTVRSGFRDWWPDNARQSVTGFRVVREVRTR